MEAGMLVADAIRAFLSHRRRRGITAGSLAAYQSHFDGWQTWRTGEQRPASLRSVDLRELERYLASVAARCKPRTVQNHRRTLKALWNWLRWELDGQGRPLLSETQLGFFANGRIAVPSVVERERPAVTKAQMEALLQAAGDGADEESARDRAIVLLLWESGARVFELAGMRTELVDLAERTARIIGKGGREGAIFWGPRGARALARYLRLRRGPLNGPLLRGCSSRNNGEAVSPNLIRLLLKRLAKRAGVTLPKGAPVHGFRHGCARELRAKGLSKEEVRDVLRHRDLKTTERYLGLDVEPARRAHRKVYGDGSSDAPRAKAAEQ
jgi:site-specific recombinase XerD